MSEYIDPKSCRIDFTGNDLTSFIGVNTFAEAENLVRTLSDEGYAAINLCSAFDEPMTKRLAEIAGDGCCFSFVTFTGAEAQKMGQARINGGKLGFIIFDEGVAQIRPFELEGALHCSIRFVDSLVMACRAAKELLLEGATFIETCSWFDDEKVKVIISTAATDVPIGTAGRNLYP